MTTSPAACQVPRLPVGRRGAASAIALRVEQVDPRGAHAMALLREAALEARALYPELFSPASPMPGNPPAAPRAVYLAAYDDKGKPVGCAALRPVDDSTAEVRRVYVLKPLRGRGVARTLLVRLEAEAVELGYQALALETGNRQPAAIALYEALGYRRIAAFGAHVGDPTSVCFGKTLTTTLPRAHPGNPDTGG